MIRTIDTLLHLAMILPLILFSALSRASLQSTGSTVDLDGISYYVHPDSVATFDVRDLRNGDYGLRPVTVITHAQHDKKIVAKEIRSRTTSDDVWQAGFLEVVIAQNPQSNVRRDGSIKAKVLARDTKLLGRNSTLVSHPHVGLADGPYFMELSTGATYMGYRLYSDFEGAFTETLIPEKNGRYGVLPANVAGQSLAVGVPSKMHYKKTTKKPLNGVRVGIKDIYDISGVRTSDGNRAWYHFYQPAGVTAPAVQRLIDAGAIIVGKMKTSQFANGETATADWVDYHEPFNPRGDGYQDTSSSSSGPGAGVGAYRWLDLALGSDTGGSIRGPAAAQGIFGNRPSHGMVSLKHVMPLSPVLDTAGFLCRDPILWAEASNVLYGGLEENYTSFPKEILLLDYPQKSKNNTPAEKHLLAFSDRLASFLSAKATHYSISEDFSKNGPASAGTTDIDDFLDSTYPILISKQQTRLVRDPFFAEYAAKHNGRRPFVDPVPLVRWAYGDSFPESTLEQAMKNKTIFAKWFNSHVLKPNESTCSDKLLLYVEGEGNPVYRNVYRSAPNPPIGFSDGRISPFSGAPDFVFPIGQSSYASTVTNHTEYLPNSISIMAANHCDGMLFSLIKELAGAGVIDTSIAGRNLVAGNDILFRKRDLY